MTEARFQIFQCSNTTCRLRFPTNLTLQHYSECPLCTSRMQPVGEPFTNYRRPAYNTSANEPGLCVLLDNLRSSENVGSIFRSANGAGVSHVYCCGTTPTPDHARVRKASLGAEDETPWSYHRNALDIASELSASGHKLIALESTPESTSLFEFSNVEMSTMPEILIIGNELSGIDPQLINLAMNVLHIPMSGGKTSLNAAVSAGIALYYLAHQSDGPIRQDSFAQKLQTKEN